MQTIIPRRGSVITSVGAGLLAIAMLALGACGGSASKSTVSAPPKPFWQTLKNVTYTYTSGSQAVASYFAYDPQTQRRVSFSGAGTDGQWFTADDTVSGYIQFALGVVGNEWRELRQTSFSGVGTDGQWFTADDTSTNGKETQYTEINGKPYITGVVFYSGPGLDGIWLTPDDAVSVFQKYYVNPSKVIATNGLETIYNTAGADGVWFTADDTISASYTPPVETVVPGGFVLDSVGGTTCGRSFYNTNKVYLGYDTTSKGTDTLCFTADDVMVRYSVVTLNAQEKPLHAITYNGAGADTNWKTADDIASGTFAGYALSSYDANGNLVQNDGYNSGANTIPLDGDDVWTNRYTYQSDADGRTIYFSRTEPGTDGAMGTSDDQQTVEEWWGAY